MSSYNKQRVCFSAIALAQKAKCDQVDDMEVEETQQLADQLLTSDDPLFHAVNQFATQWLTNAHDFERVRAMGHALFHAVELASMPVPPGQDRADIHG